MPDLVTAFTDAPARMPADGFLGTGDEPELLERVGERQVQAGAVEVVQVRRAVERVRHAEVVAAGHRDADAGVHAVAGRRRRSARRRRTG